MAPARRLVRVLAITLACTLGCVPFAGAFEVTLKPTRTERKLAAKSGVFFRLNYATGQGLVHAFSDPVHEGITHLAYECPLSNLADCADAELDVAPGGVIAGLRWNDDPPFRFADGEGKYPLCKGQIDPANPKTVSYSLAFACWLAHFQDARKVAEARPDAFHGRGTLLARSHFGDLQFLHAMASAMGDPAQQTRARILTWAEFTWKVQSIVPAERIAANARVGSLAIAGLADHFPAREERTVQDLFTLGRPWFRHQLADVAFGSLLHMVQDSFAGGHVRRSAAPVGSCDVPPIEQFHTYAGQPGSDHKYQDGLERAKTKVEAGALMAPLVRLRDLRARGASWEDVRPYLEDCVFALAPGASAATAEVSE